MQMPMKKTSQFQRGLAAIEFALLLPILLILAFAAIDFGRLLYQYDTLSKSTRDAAKYVARTVKPAANALPEDITAYNTTVAQAMNLALCGTIAACGGSALVDGLTATNIAIDYPARVGNITYVRILVSNYSTSYITDVLGVGKDLGTISVTMRQIQQ